MAVTITQLRKNNDFNKKLGFIERDILYSKGAKAIKASDFPAGFYEVVAGTRSFTFNWNSKVKPRYQIVG